MEVVNTLDALVYRQKQISYHHAQGMGALADATWRRLLTDPVAGEALEFGTAAYRPPAGTSAR